MIDGIWGVMAVGTLIAGGFGCGLAFGWALWGYAFSASPESQELPLLEQAIVASAVEYYNRGYDAGKAEG